MTIIDNDILKLPKEDENPTRICDCITFISLSGIHRNATRSKLWSNFMALDLLIFKFPNFQILKLHEIFKYINFPSTNFQICIFSNFGIFKFLNTRISHFRFFKYRHFYISELSNSFSISNCLNVSDSFWLIFILWNFQLPRSSNHRWVIVSVQVNLLMSRMPWDPSHSDQCKSLYVVIGYF